MPSTGFSGQVRPPLFRTAIRQLIGPIARLYMNGAFRVSCYTLFSLMLFCGAARTQTLGVPIVINGVVEDTNGNRVVAAKVSVSEDGGTFRQTTTTDRLGTYQISATARSFAVRVEADGFCPSDRSLHNIKDVDRSKVSLTHVMFAWAFEHNYVLKDSKLSTGGSVAPPYAVIRNEAYGYAIFFGRQGGTGEVAEFHSIELFDGKRYPSMFVYDRFLIRADSIRQTEPAKLFFSGHVIVEDGTTRKTYNSISFDLRDKMLFD